MGEEDGGERWRVGRAYFPRFIPRPKNLKKIPHESRQLLDRHCGVGPPPGWWMDGDGPVKVGTHARF